jgi:hypothetical protein
VLPVVATYQTMVYLKVKKEKSLLFRGFYLICYLGSEEIEQKMQIMHTHNDKYDIKGSLAL